MTATVAGIHLGIDTHANRPAANTVPDGSLYSCSTHNLVYKGNNSGNTWATWATVGASGSTSPGYEIDYVQVTSATTNITHTTEGTADTLVTGSAVAYDGSTVVVIEFFAPGIVTTNTTSASVLLWLYDGSSSIGALGGVVTVANSALQVPVLCRRRLTPSAATHTYSVRGSTSAGTGVMDAGAGGTGVYVPAYIRITKV